MKIINFEKKQMIPLTSKELESYASQETFAKNSLKTSTLMLKNIKKLEIIFMIQVNAMVLHIAYII